MARNLRRLKSIGAAQRGKEASEEESVLSYTTVATAPFHASDSGGSLDLVACVPGKYLCGGHQVASGDQRPGLL